MERIVKYLSLALLILAATCFQAEGIVNVTIYNTKLDDFTDDMQTLFTDALAVEAKKYCAESCSAEFSSSNLTAKVEGKKYAKPHLNFTVTIHKLTAEGVTCQLPECMLSDDHTVEIISGSEDALEKAIGGGKQILACNHIDFGIKPDNPTNWILISLFIVITLVLLGVVLYLSKHKVNHADEHYEQMKTKDSSADGEIAA